MAVDYADLFEDLGKLVKHSNALAVDAAALDTDLAEIEAAFTDGTLGSAFEGTRGGFSAAKGALITLRRELASVAERRLTDRDTIIEELNLASSDRRTVIAALIRDMIANSESVNASAVTIGSVSAAGTNTGNGTVLTTKVLDGASNPTFDSDPHPDYMGLDSELAIAETMNVVCVSDSYADGLTAGSEQFQWDGELPDFDRWGVEGEGSGTGPLVTSGGGIGLIQNGSLETFSSNLPQSWSLYAGTAGTHVSEETSTVYRGSSALKITGDGVQAAAGISQAPPAGLLVPRKRYCVALRYRASATDTASQAFVCQFEGTGYTAGTGEKIEIDGDDFVTGAWTLASFFVNMPANLPSDLKLVIKTTGTLGNTKTVLVDSVTLAPVEWHNGIGIVVVAGDTDWVKGDRLSFTVSNTEGVFQKFFRQAFGSMLPSNSSASETRADSLAT